MAYYLQSIDSMVYKQIIFNSYTVYTAQYLYAAISYHTVIKNNMYDR